MRCIGECRDNLHNLSDDLHLIDELLEFGESFFVLENFLEETTDDAAVIVRRSTLHAFRILRIEI